jgi:hypothetical protein
MLQLSHLTKTISHMWKIGSKRRRNTHAFLGRFDVEHKLQRLLKMLYNNKKKNHKK